MNVRKMLGALAFGAAMLVPAYASAQGRSDHGGRHDNGLHKGWDKNGKRDRDHDRDDRSRWDRNRGRDDRRDWDRDRRAQAIARNRQIQWDSDARNRDFQRARDQRNREAARRQSSKNQWRNLSYLGGAAGVYGLLTGNKTVAALGLGGGLYSLYRYEQDRKSQSRDNRSRYELFNRSAFDYNGHRYVRRTKNQNGQKYYYFQRSR